MNDHDNARVAGLLAAAASEIKQLREQVAVLAPAAEAWNVLKTVVQQQPRPSQGMAIDIVWELKRVADELTPPPAATDQSAQERSQ